uniref:AT5G09920-like protein n=1 Tax=Arabidopsis arenosa TaxID=38785 RepID=B7U9V3_ARAAE|nr:AT5G09920-like protein [Arabidopsis arenosa]
MKTTKTMSEAECKRWFLYIAKFIKERLSEPKLKQYVGLMKQFRSRHIQGDELIKSLQNLFQEDERYKTYKIMKIPKQSQEKEQGVKAAKNDDEIEEGEIEEDEHCPCPRCKIGREEAIFTFVVSRKKKPEAEQKRTFRFRFPSLVIAMSGEEEENAAELKIGDEFLKAKCLMNCEVSLILEHKFEQLQQVSEDPMNQVSQVFEKSLQYVKRFSRYKNPDAVRQVREILSRHQLTEFELCVLGNLCPETVEEAVAMVPSLKWRSDNLKRTNGIVIQKEELMMMKQLRRCSMISPLSRDSSRAEDSQDLRLRTFGRMLYLPSS